jgi:glycosyltransferase involved in cell wall biosynthesis
MKIAFVIPYFYPALQYGGQPKSCYDLARALVERGHNVTVLTTDSAGSARLPTNTLAPTVQDLHGIKVLYYRNISNRLAFRHRLFLPYDLFRDMRVRLKDHDVVHIHELRSTLTVAAFKAARRLGMPYVLSPHGGLRHLGKAFAKRVFDALYGRSVLGHASFLFAVSPQEEKEALAFGVEASRVRLVPNTIFPQDYVSLPRAGTFRERWSIDAKNLVLFIGRLHWIKGADILVQAFSVLLKSSPDTHLVVAGPDDGQLRELQQLAERLRIQNSITFPGYLDHDAKLAALVDADVLTIPSRSEIFAILAVEALMCGTPVLLSSACGLSPMPPRDLGVQHFESGDANDLNRRLVEILSEHRRPPLEQMRQFVSAEFSPSRIAKIAESAYTEAVGEGGKNS